MYTSSPSPTTVVTGHGSTAATGADLGLAAFIMLGALILGLGLALIARTLADR